MQPLNPSYQTTNPLASGKSSLILALLRLLDLKSGIILINNINISTLPRQTIRSRLVAIPQEPLKLSSTLRSYLSPPTTTTTSSSPSDQEITTALTKVNLWSTILARGGLDNPMDDLPLSQGQHQLLSLAHALLRKRAGASGGGILLLDEPTSAVDAGTETHMQALVRNEFKGYTVIAVAHRLQTIVRYDQVVVMDRGRVVEVGEPGVLLGKEGGAFRGLLQNKGH
jgi:ATP-binding cassette, subfamily C (CFTR/MRP), member 1